jgi:hypothetical protein
MKLVELQAHQIVAMRFLGRSFATLTIVVAHQLLAAQTPASMNVKADVRSGSFGMPKMQLGKSSQYDVQPSSSVAPLQFIHPVV